MLHFDGHDQPHEACDEDGSGSMTYDEMLGVFRKFGTSATLSLSSIA
jgi:Ca2+-binding EF-hand superfamily protein